MSTKELLGAFVIVVVLLMCICIFWIQYNNCAAERGTLVRGLFWFVCVDRGASR